MPRCVIGLPKPQHRKPSYVARDRRESAKVRARSGGRCEVTVDGLRCPRAASEVHHHKGGWKLRGRGASALAENKTDTCVACHRLITGIVGAGQPLVHVAGNTYHWRQAEKDIA